MKSIAIIITLFFVNTICYGQYIWDEKIYTDDWDIKSMQDVSGHIGCKGKDNTVRLYENYDNNGKRCLAIKTVSLNDLKILRVDKIDDDITDFRYENFIAGTNYDVILSAKKLFVYNRNTKKYSLYQDENFRYNHGFEINDSIICLSNIYHYHPQDGHSGLTLALFNVNTMTVVSKKNHSFRGVGLSSLNVDWVYCNNNSIFAVSPLSGVMYKYNSSDLELSDSIRIPVKWRDYQGNLSFQNTLDSIIASEYTRLMDVDAKSAKHSSGTSIYNSNFINKVIDTVRREYEFIEKVLQYSDSAMLLVMYKPYLLDEKRDILIYNFVDNRIETYIPNWQCANKQELGKFEDYFTVNVGVSSYYAPYFHNKKVYFITLANPFLYQGEYTSDTLLKKIIIDSRQNGNHLHLLEYDIEEYDKLSTISASSM